MELTKKGLVYISSSRNITVLELVIYTVIKMVMKEIFLKYIMDISTLIPANILVIIHIGSGNSLVLSGKNTSLVAVNQV